MTTNSNPEEKILYKDLSYQLVGLMMRAQKELGSFAREKQYCDWFEQKLKENKISYIRELRIGDSGNIADFDIDGKIIIEFKTAPFITSEHYDQIKRYLYQTGYQLGLLVNFRDKRINPKRILNINNLRNPAEHL